MQQINKAHEHFLYDKEHIRNTYVSEHNSSLSIKLTLPQLQQLIPTGDTNSGDRQQTS
jgi:hypothetical protein